MCLNVYVVIKKEDSERTHEERLATVISGVWDYVKPLRSVQTESTLTNACSNWGLGTYVYDVFISSPHHTVGTQIAVAQEQILVFSLLVNLGNNISDGVLFKNDKWLP